MTAVVPDAFVSTFLEEQRPILNPGGGPVLAAASPATGQAVTLLNPAALKPQQIDWRDTPVGVERERRPSDPDPASLDQVFSTGEWLIEVV